MSFHKREKSTINSKLYWATNCKSSVTNDAIIKPHGQSMYIFHFEIYITKKSKVSMKIRFRLLVFIRRPSHAIQFIVTPLSETLFALGPPCVRRVEALVSYIRDGDPPS